MSAKYRQITVHLPHEHAAAFDKKLAALDETESRYCVQLILHDLGIKAAPWTKKISERLSDDDLTAIANRVRQILAAQTAQKLPGKRLGGKEDDGIQGTGT